MTLILILSILLGISLPLSIFFLFLFLKARKLLKDNFHSNFGYYTYLVNLVSKNKTEPYNCVVHVKEVDRYTNGDSKIELIKVEVISGLEIDKYDWVKTCVKEKFSSLYKTADIEWLESKEDIKELRRQKLKKIGIK